MEFCPCIDIHNGKVKQIVGASLKDQGDYAEENYVAAEDAAYFAKLYQKNGIRRGHIILLNPKHSEYYEATKKQALSALRAYPGGMQAGGGMTPENAGEFLDAGASHVIVTSYVFSNGSVNYENLSRLRKTVGKEHLVLDLSCRKLGGAYYIVTDRWQKFTNEAVTPGLLDRLSGYADEFLVHAADVEGKASGVEVPLVEMLGNWGEIPVTYAGGIGSFKDLDILRECGKNRLDFTIGSALDLFGGNMAYREVIKYVKNQNTQ